MTSLTRPHAEEYSAARLFGIAQRAMEDALTLDDAEIRAHLTKTLAEITAPAVAPLAISERLRSIEHGPGEVLGIDRDHDLATIRWEFEVNGQHVIAMSLRWAETECLRGAAA
jgi:hypothetical protein